MIPLNPQVLDTDQRRLLTCFAKLGESDRETLLAFADFLVARSPSEDNTAAETPQQPKEIPRPKKESVVAAIRRLSETYYMLDRGELLTEASSLMSAHIMHGRAAAEVIDDLEAMFSTYYKQHQGTAGN